MSLFNKKNGGLTVGSVLIFVGFPLLLSGQFVWGGLSILLAMTISAAEYINESDKLEIRFNVLTPEDVLAELEQRSEIDGDNQSTKKEEKKSHKIPIDDEETRIKYYVEGLSALARKYSKSDRKQDLSLPYQQLAFTTIRLYPENDKVVAGSISLLALIAKDPRVRKRFKYQAEDYGLDQPIVVLKKALERAKTEEDETKEELLAEILRKGCLFIGAVCNDGEDLGLSSIIVAEGGLELIIDAANWFRLHEDVSNWALWAIFTLSYDQISIKTQLIRLQGIEAICRLMENNPTSLEVNRHGIAILFDLLREYQGVDGLSWDPWEIRKIALASGLHNRALSAMNEFSDSMDMMMMGQEMLIGTGFRGDIPKYQQI